MIANQNIPKLRFKEFQEKWESKNLGILSDLITKGTTPKIFSKDGIRYIKIESFCDDFIDIKKCLFIDEETHKKELKRSILKEDDILFAIAGATVGKVNIVTNEILPANTNQALSIIRLKKNVNKNFVFYNLKSEKMKRYIIESISVGAQPNLNLEQMNNFSFYCPSINEQEKISSFLIKVDKLIENLKNQKENLEKYKKGMMQKIFAQKIRFKDESGKEFEEWKEKKIEKILSERKEYSTKGKGYPHISLTTQGVVPKSERYNRDFLVGDDEIKGYKITRLNDLCYNPANLKFGVISINKLGSGIFSPIYVTFEIVNQNIDFVGYYLIRNEFINKARKYEQGTVYERMAVSPIDFLKVKITFPSPPEQQKIAEFLTLIDKLINSKQEQIAKADEWKKGLMQGLFV